MAKSQVITEEMVEQALKILHKRIAEPPPASVKSYSQKDAFARLKARAKEALAAGHSLETILDDLKGVGIGMTLSTARQYMKPGRKTKRSQVSTSSGESGKERSTPASSSATTLETNGRGTFAVTEDAREI